MNMDAYMRDFADSRTGPTVITETGIRMLLEWCGGTLQSFCTQGEHHG